MSRGISLSKVLCGIAMAIGGLLALIFLLDLAIGFPFDRFSWLADVFVLLGAGLLLWQSIETWMDL